MTHAEANRIRKQIPFSVPIAAIAGGLCWLVEIKEAEQGRNGKIVVNYRKEGWMNMSFKDNFGNPKGLLGKLMLAGMNMGHSPMAKWGFTQFTVPAEGKIVDIGCGGGFNVKRLLE